MHKHFFISFSALGAFAFVTLACSATQSSFSAGQTSSQKISSKSAQAEVAKTPERKPTPAPDPGTNVKPTEQAVIKSQECWFAVSGTYVGLGDYSDTFPKPTSGKPIANGEKFDTVGGVFLYARPEPYVYKEGGGEIDAAVDYTFDGIVVPPGMSVEIRSSANDEPIYKGQGPLIAIAGKAEATGYGGSLTFKEKFDAGGLKHWPQWMQDYLTQSGGKVEMIYTHPARWVKVSVVEGGRCAQ